MNRSFKSVSRVEDISESIVSMESNDIVEDTENPNAVNAVKTKIVSQAGV